MKSTLLALLSVVVLLLCSSAPVAAGQKIVNKDKTPSKVTVITNSKGEPRSALYMTGEEMVFGDDGWPNSGSGYIEALPGNTYYIPFQNLEEAGKPKFGGLRVQRIDWDASGRTVSIKGLQSEFEAEKNIKIVSDVNKPKMEDGVLYLRFQGAGDKEFKVTIKFGKGALIEPKGFWALKAHEKAQPAPAGDGK